MAKPVTTEDAVMSKIKDFQRFRNSQYKNAALALPGGLSAARTQGMGAMREHVQSFFPQPGVATDPLKKAALKAEIAANMAAAASKLNDQKASAADKFKAQTDMIDVVFDFLVGLYGSQASVANGLNSARQQAITSLHNNMVDARTSTTNELIRASDGEGGSERVSALFEQDFGKDKFSTGRGGQPLFGGGGYAAAGPYAGESVALDDKAVERIKAKMFGYTYNEKGEMVQTGEAPLSPGEQRAYIFMLKDRFGTEGVLQALNSDPQLSSIINDPAFALPAVVAAGNEQLTMETPEVIKTALQSMRGIADTGVMTNQALEIIDRLGGATTPEEAQKQLQGFIDKNLGPENQPALDAMEKLLDQMDVPDEQMPTHIAEAKRQLFESAEFQREKERLGFTTDKEYFQYAKKKLKDRQHKNKMQDMALRQQLEFKQGGGSSAESAKAVPNSKQVEAAKKQANSSAAASEPIGGDTSPRPSSPTVNFGGQQVTIDEAAALSGADVPEPGSGLPASGPDAYKPTGLQPSAPGPEANAYPEWAPDAYRFPSQGKIRNLGQVAEAVKDRVSRPRDTYERLLKGMFSATKKKGQADTPDGEVIPLELDIEDR